jgi:signal peptidase I
VPDRAPQGKGKSRPTETKDSTREIVETVVFVVVLVLLLKTFVAEAFVIPTGSMATTLYGYQKDVKCPECGFEFPVNCSGEAEEKRPPIQGAICPNCFYDIDFRKEKMNPSCNTGDRVLVAKNLYDSRLMDLKPLDVVVFKFPEEPQVAYVPMNYIKRLIGLPGQTIGIYYGDLYVADGDPAAEGAAPVNDENLPPRRRMHRDQGKVLLERGDSRFRILRKPPDKIDALKRIVYNNDHQPKDQVKEGYPPRWAPEKAERPVTDNTDTLEYLKNRERAEKAKAWVADAPNGFKHARSAGADFDWLRYRHVIGRISPKPRLINDFMGYNSGYNSGNPQSQLNWVGDLILDCEIKVEDVQAGDEVRLELSKGVDRFQARFQPESGLCTLVRIKAGGEQEEMAKQGTRLKKPGTYHVQFANVDRRLTVWVDGALPFSEGHPYEAPQDLGPTARNDLEPAGIAVRGGAVAVHKLVLWRDTYYTYHFSPVDRRGQPVPGHEPNNGSLHDDDWSDPAAWAKANLDKLPATTLYVQPHHYLCLGDNSPQSSDSRSWGQRNGPGDEMIGGLVPESLLLGRAMLIYYPITSRARVIR